MGRKILVYGAGVQGCYLAHKLLEAQNDVTLLARGEWADQLKRDGMYIKHFPQVKTTYDKVKITRELYENDIFDAIFVVMQYSQLPAIFDFLQTNKSKTIIFIGNNANPKQAEGYFAQSDKEILFGFLSSGGRREGSIIKSIHIKNKLTLGKLDGMLTDASIELIKSVFSDDNQFQLSFQENMEEWLYTHLAFILPLCYACYAVDGHMNRWNKKMKNQIMDAVCEEYDILLDCGFRINPAGEYDYAKNNRKAFLKFLFLISKTFVGKLAISDHAMNAVHEMKLLSFDMDRFNKQSNLLTPSYDELRNFLEMAPKDNSK